MRVSASFALMIPLIAGIAATSAASDLPAPWNSSHPACFALVGETSGVPDAAGQFTVVVRDITNNPVAFSVIILDFSQCPDLRFASSQPWQGLATDCSTHRIQATADRNGSATFRVLGGASNTGASPGGGPQCLRVYADGVLLGSSTVQAYDQEGQGGMNSNDVSVLIADLFSGTYFGRSDFDCSQTLGSNDLSLWLSAYFVGGSTTSAPAVCGP